MRSRAKGILTRLEKLREDIRHERRYAGQRQLAGPLWLTGMYLDWAIRDIERYIQLKEEHG